MDLQRRLKRNNLVVAHFAQQHPDMDRYIEEMVRLILDYGASLPGAYRVAKERAKETACR